MHHFWNPPAEQVRGTGFNFQTGFKDYSLKKRFKSEFQHCYIYKLSEVDYMFTQQDIKVVPNIGCPTKFIMEVEIDPSPSKIKSCSLDCIEN